MAIHPFDDLRSLASFNKPDPRSGGSTATRSMFRRAFHAHHAEVDRLRLNATVPEDLQIHFLTACNLLLYSWYVHRFLHVAELHALGSLEWGLRDRLRADKRGNPPRLKSLLKLAVDAGLLKDAPLRAFQRWMQAQERNWLEEQSWPEEFRKLFGSAPKPEPPLDKAAWVRRLCDRLPVLRNELAHGSPLLFPEGLLRVEICCDLLNQLYPLPDPRKTSSFADEPVR